MTFKGVLDWSINVSESGMWCVHLSPSQDSANAARFFLTHVLSACPNQLETSQCILHKRYLGSLNRLHIFQLYPLRSILSTSTIQTFG